MKIYLTICLLIIAICLVVRRRANKPKQTSVGGRFKSETVKVIVALRVGDGSITWIKGYRANVYRVTRFGQPLLTGFKYFDERYVAIDPDRVIYSKRIN